MMSMGLDAVLIALLVVALIMFFRLERRLNALRKGQDGMRVAARELMEAAIKAETAIRQLRAATQDAKALADAAAEPAHAPNLRPSPARAAAGRRY